MCVSSDERFRHAKLNHRLVNRLQSTILANRVKQVEQRKPLIGTRLAANGVEDQGNNFSTLMQVLVTDFVDRVQQRKNFANLTKCKQTTTKINNVQ